MTTTASSPFCVDSTLPYVARVEGRLGYVQFATREYISTFAELPLELLAICQKWASLLEAHPECERVYWVLLSEQVPHLHYHLYPRLTSDALKGTALFDDRFNLQHQPAWPAELKEKLHAFCNTEGVHLIPPTTELW
jgi:diadenosine tetraphosphate (Ap4A) HIT family hydrolase